MTEVNTPLAEDAALHLVHLLTSPAPCLGLAPNGAVSERQLKGLFTLEDWEEADYDPGIRYAEAKGWIKRVANRIQITKEGYQLASRLGTSTRPHHG
jgi:hypothetical protein